MEEIIKKLESMGACEEALEALCDAEGAKTDEQFYQEALDNDWVAWFTSKVSDRSIKGGVGCDCNYCSKRRARSIDPLTLNQILQCLECEWKT